MIRNVWAVARREVRGYFDQPTAYVLVVAFLGISLFLAYRAMYAMGVADLRPIFDMLPMLFAVFVPAATMRSLAEERRSRTLEWLLAQPVSELEVVLGKLLGCWIFVMIALAGTVPTAVAVLLVSDADAGIVVAQYVGAGFLALQFVSLGLWASSFTRNQITAFIVAAMAAFVLFLIGLPVVQIGLPPAIAGGLARLSVLSHFQNVARGVVDLRDVVYFVSTTALFVVLALGAILRERLSHARAEWGRMRVGAAVVALLVLVVNLLGSYVRGRIDLTTENLYTLEEGTRDLLAELDDLVEIQLFASSTLPAEMQLQLRDVRDVLADMEGASNGNLRVTEVDPDEDEEAVSEAEQLGIYPVEFNVLSEDQFSVRQGYYGLVIRYAERTDVTPVINRTDDLEFRLASTIYDMTTTDRVGFGYAMGFGMQPIGDVPGLMQSLGQRYDIRAVDLTGDTVAPIDRAQIEVLVIRGPTEPFSDAALQRVREFVDAGGAVFAMLDPVFLDPESLQPVPITTGLQTLLESRGLTLAPNVVADLASSANVNVGNQGVFQVVLPYPLWPIARPAADHAIVSGLNSITMGWAGAIVISDSANVTPLWQTSEAAALRDPTLPILPDQDWNIPEEEWGVRTLAAAVTVPEGDARGRLVVVADATFAEGQFVQPNQGNLAFLANSIDWLAQNEALIRIRSKDRTPPSLIFESDLTRNSVKWGNLVGVPLLFVLFGLWRVTGRRRRAEAKWREVVA
ncbi:MAG: Gldg family protein [Longimicrobiales bacterium]